MRNKTSRFAQKAVIFSVKLYIVFREEEEIIDTTQGTIVGLGQETETTEMTSKETEEKGDTGMMTEMTEIQEEVL